MPVHVSQQATPSAIGLGAPLSAKRSTDSSNERLPDCVRAMLINRDGLKLLMFHDEYVWKLPQFTYPKGVRYNMDRCCKDLCECLHVDTEGETPFSVFVELLGQCATLSILVDDDPGYIRLVMVECHLYGLEVPKKC